jgi:hypothetical protein
MTARHRSPSTGISTASAARSATATDVGTAVAAAVGTTVGTTASSGAAGRGTPAGAVGRGGGNSANQTISTTAESSSAISVRRSITNPERSGTGSQPRVPRVAAGQPSYPEPGPRAAPKRRTASSMYSEQVGSNRQAGGSHGETKRL